MNHTLGMYFIYIDESYDQDCFVYSALFVDAFKWNHYFKALQDWRERWYEEHGIPMEYELHATKIVGGRGEYPKNRDKDYRAGLFYEIISRIEKMAGFKIMYATAKASHRKVPEPKRMKAFDWMLNRIDRTLKSYAAMGILICDEGNEHNLTAKLREKRKHNSIPVAGTFDDSRDIPLIRIIEDPLFKQSDSSYFIQLADLLAFALLRHEHPCVNTNPKVQRAFEQLNSVLIKEAFRDDPKGIIRIW